MARVVAAAAWLVLAGPHPHVTYHLPPLLVAGAWPLALRRLAGGPAIALASTALLAAMNALAGPTLTGTGSALAETLITVGIGAIQPLEPRGGRAGITAREDYFRPLPVGSPRSGTLP